jgi:hypothetical protein
MHVASFHMDVAKVDWDVAHSMLQVPVLNVSSVFQTYVANVFI